MTDLISREAALAAVMHMSDAYERIYVLPAAQVKVKPLGWKWSERVQGWRADCELTRDVFIAYQSNEKWSAGSQWFGTTYHPTADAGKFYLDQMRAARVLAALDLSPTAVDASQTPDPVINPCGGCGETDPEKRCIGCQHDFGDESGARVRNVPDPVLSDPRVKALVEALRLIADDDGAANWQGNHARAALRAIGGEA